MKKIICLVLILIFSSNAYALELEGGIKFDVQSAREYVQEAQENNITISGHTDFNKDDKNIKKVVYSYNNYGSVIGVTVQYKSEPDMAYIYVNDALKYVDKYDKDVDIYPHRGYRYNLQGRLILTSLTVSKKEQFRFSPNGQLIAHAKNGIIYDESGNVIGTASK